MLRNLGRKNFCLNWYRIYTIRNTHYWKTRESPSCHLYPLLVWELSDQILYWKRMCHHYYFLHRRRVTKFLLKIHNQRCQHGRSCHLELRSFLACYLQAGHFIIPALDFLSPRIKMSAGDPSFVHMENLLIYQPLVHTHTQAHTADTCLLLQHNWAMW